MRCGAIVALVMLASCKRTSAPSSPDAALPPPPPASAALRVDAPPDETVWIGELSPGPVERRVCFSSPAPLRPISEAAVDTQSFLFVAKVVAQGWTEKPLRSRKRVGSIYLSVADALRGDSLKPSAVIALPIDDPACSDAGPCGFDWSLAGPGAMVVVGCSAPRAHAPHQNAVLDVPGPKAVVVEELRRCVSMAKAAKAGAPIEAGAPDGGLAVECFERLRQRNAADAGASPKPKASGSRP